MSDKRPGVYPPFQDGAAPLDEEAEAPELPPDYVRTKSDPTYRRLQAIAGAGVGYIFLTFPDGQVAFDINIDPANVPEVLRLAAEALA